jgi:hypothetical protein
MENRDGQPSWWCFIWLLSVAVYFAADPLDITAAAFFLSLGVYLYLHNYAAATLKSGLAAGLAIAPAVCSGQRAGCGGFVSADLFFSGQRRKAFAALFAVVIMTVPVVWPLVAFWQFS